MPTVVEAFFLDIFMLFNTWCHHLWGQSSVFPQFHGGKKSKCAKDSEKIDATHMNSLQLISTIHFFNAARQ